MLQETLNPIYTRWPRDRLPQFPKSQEPHPHHQTLLQPLQGLQLIPHRQSPPRTRGRVASGKRLAERNRLAREAKKKAQAEAASASASASTSASATTSDGGGGLSLSTLLGIGGLIVSLGGLYYQREAIRARFRPTPPPPTPAPAPVPEPAPSRIPVRQGGIKKME